jgi:hypothetical protein
MLDLVGDDFAKYPVLYYAAGCVLSFGAVFVYAKLKFMEWDRKNPHSGENQFAIFFLAAGFIAAWPLFWSFLFWTFVYEFMWKKIEEKNSGE